MPLPSSLESLRLKVSEGKWTESRRWVEGEITARKYRTPHKKFPMAPRGGSWHDCWGPMDHALVAHPPAEYVLAVRPPRPRWQAAPTYFADSSTQTIAGRR